MLHTNKFMPALGPDHVKEQVEKYLKCWYWTYKMGLLKTRVSYSRDIRKFRRQSFIFSFALRLLGGVRVLFVAELEMPSPKL